MRFVRTTAFRAALLLLCLTTILLAGHGSLQPYLDLWMQKDSRAAQAGFATLSSDPLAQLNDLIAQTQLLEQNKSAGARDWQNLADAFLALDVPGKKLEFQRKYFAGSTLLTAGDTTKAIAVLEQAVELDSESQYSANLLLAALYERGHLKRLETWCRKLQKVREDNPWPYLYLARLLRETGRTKEALEVWKAGIQVYPLRTMLEEAIAAAANRYPALSRNWLDILGHRYHHVYDDSTLHRLAVMNRVPHLLGGLATIAERRARMEQVFPQFFPPQREWEYAVSFGFIPLGTLIVGVDGEEFIDPFSGVPSSRVYYKIDSNPIYRWLIDLHDEYSSVIPTHCLNSLEFKLFSIEGTDRYETHYHSDFKHGAMVVHGYRKSGVLQFQTLPLAQEVFDGLSLLFAARRQVQEERFGAVLTIIDEEMHRTILEADGHGQVRSLGQRVPVRKVHGLADYKGIAGLTGEFWGSFSDDERSLPLEAKFQIAVGKISLRLKEIRDF